MKAFVYFLAKVAGLLTMLLIGFSCEITETPYQTDSNESLIDETISEILAISKGSVNISEQDAEKVALMYLNANTQVKSSATINNTITIKDNNDKPVIFAINFNDGYILVSATKEYYPILAEIPHGHFSLEDRNTGENILINEYISTISQKVNDNVEDKKFRPLWIPYERNKNIISLNSKDDALRDAQEKWISKWHSEGRTVYPLTQKPENMSEELYNQFCASAELMKMSGYDYMECSRITEYVNNNNYIYTDGAKIQTQWGQRSPFNDSDPGDNDLGCTTIAAGQIMRFFKYPKNYLWDDMPNNTSNKTLSDFLFELKGKIGVNETGGATIKQVKNVLVQYGYNCEIKPHNITDVNTSLINNKPIYMRGQDTINDLGHAWVCDRMRTSQPYVEYQLFVLIPIGNNLDYISADSHTIYSQTLTTYHMNWGWAGYRDGWYTASHSLFPNNRQNIIINGHK